MIRGSMGASILGGGGGRGERHERQEIITYVISKIVGRLPRQIAMIACHGAFYTLSEMNIPIRMTRNCPSRVLRCPFTFAPMTPNTAAVRGTLLNYSSPIAHP